MEGYPEGVLTPCLASPEAPCNAVAWIQQTIHLPFIMGVNVVGRLGHAPVSGYSAPVRFDIRVDGVSPERELRGGKGRTSWEQFQGVLLFGNKNTPRARLSRGVMPFLGASHRLPSTNETICASYLGKV